MNLHSDRIYSKILQGAIPDGFNISAKIHWHVNSSLQSYYSQFILTFVVPINSKLVRYFWYLKD